MRIKHAIAFASVLALAACTTNQPATVSDGECKVFDPPQYTLHGSDKYSQQYMDETVAVGVSVCEWNRPSPNPFHKPATVNAPSDPEAPSGEPRGWFGG